MKRLFLSSSFTDVAGIFENALKKEIKGKTITFIPTAGNVEKMKFYIGTARKAFEKMGLIVDELDISKASFDEISDKLSQNNYIYVSGGNTFFLLQELRKSGADKLIVEQINSGKLYVGESAGAMVVSPDIEYAKDMDDCKKAPDLDSFSALDIIDFYPLPHYKNFPFAKSADKIIAKYATKLNLCPISNSQTIWVNGDEIKIETR